MRVESVKNIQAELRRYVRAFVPPSDNAEYVAAALSADDPKVLCKVALDERGVAGAMSYTVYPDELHIWQLGSLVKGAGTRLISSAERLAAKKGIPVTVASAKAALGFYARRGYSLRESGQKHGSVVDLVKYYR